VAARCGDTGVVLGTMQNVEFRMQNCAASLERLVLEDSNPHSPFPIPHLPLS
jgi:hypothetical protein